MSPPRPRRPAPGRPGDARARGRHCAVRRHHRARCGGLTPGRESVSGSSARTARGRPRSSTSSRACAGRTGPGRSPGGRHVARGAQRARRGLRRTFQRVQAFGWLTVEDNVLAALEWRGGGGGFVADLVVLPDPPSARAGAARSGSTRCSSVAGCVAVRRELAGSLPDRRRPDGRAGPGDRRRAEAAAARRAGVGARRDRDRAPRRADPGRARRDRVRRAARRAQRRLRDAAERPHRGAQPRARARGGLPGRRSSATRRCATPTSARSTRRRRPATATAPTPTTPTEPRERGP